MFQFFVTIFDHFCGIPGMAEPEMKLAVVCWGDPWRKALGWKRCPSVGDVRLNTAGRSSELGQNWIKPELKFWYTPLEVTLKLVTAGMYGCHCLGKWTFPSPRFRASGEQLRQGASPGVHFDALACLFSSKYDASPARSSKVSVFWDCPRLRQLYIGV